VHVFDNTGKIINSTLTKEQNITGMKVVGSYVGEHLHPGDVVPFMRKLERCLEKGTEVVTYRVENRLYLGKMAKISSNRVRMYDYNITGMNLEDVIKII